MTFIGHGAYGFVFKKAWIPFYQVLGFGPEISHILMPVTGLMDIIMGILALFLPLRAIFLHLSVWGVFTAVLRPLAADLAPLAQYSWYEVLERGGNYGPAIVMMCLVGCGNNGFTKGLFERIAIPTFNSSNLRIVKYILHLSVVFLLIGHAGYGFAMHKTMLMNHYNSIGFRIYTINHFLLVTSIGVFEFVLALVSLVKPSNALLVFVIAWKVSTEWLYVTASPTYFDVFEFVERGGSYLAPLALIYIQQLISRDSSPSLRPILSPSAIG